MRIAYFSPLPPHQTGIATYSAHLLLALRNRAQIELFTSDFAGTPCHGLPVIDLSRHPESLLDLRRFDARLYHLGNSLFHVDIFRALLQHPGTVVLHDTVLYYLAVGLGRGGLYKELCFNLGPIEAQLAIREIELAAPDGDIRRYRTPEKYPLLGRALARATSVIVHSEFARRIVQATGFQRPVNVIPLLSYPSAVAAADATASSVVRGRYGIPPDCLLFGIFGFGGAAKRIPALVAALQELAKDHDFRVLVVGIGYDQYAGMLNASALRSRVVRTDFVPEADFAPLLHSVDVLLNPRHPTMGETSATVTQAMGLARSCIVTNEAWFAELPDNAVVKVPYGDDEVRELIAAMRALARDPLRRALIGNAARLWAETHCAPDRVARDYINAVRNAEPLRRRGQREQAQRPHASEISRHPR